MKPEKKHWRLSPAAITLTTAFIVIALTMLIGWLNARRYRVNAHVEIGEPVTVNEEPTSPAPTTIALLPDGEVARMAERIREATGLLMGLTVLAVTEQMNSRTSATVDGLIALMLQRGLFPPNISATSTKGVLASFHATIYLRYRPQPLGIEIISVGRDALDGPTVIVRLDANSMGDSGAVLLVAKRKENIALPEAFAPLTQVPSLNWSIDPLRERSFDPQEIDQLYKWAVQYAANGK